MANLSSLFHNQPFKPSDIETVYFTPLPKGSYTCEIVESEINAIKNGKGTILILKMIIQDVKYNGRILYENLCIQHSNETAQRIAQSRLKQICDAIGLQQLSDSNQLHEKPLLVLVDVELDEFAMNKRADGEKVFRNTIKGFGIAKDLVIENDTEFDDDIPFDF